MASLTKRENLVNMAKLAEQEEQYEEMMESMKSLAKLNVELSVEERNLVSVACKKVVGEHRDSWRILSLIDEKKVKAKGNYCRLKEYRKEIESEVFDICSDIISIIDNHLIPHSSSGESNVFYYKMKGDFYRYLAEFKSGDERKDAANESLKAYQEASTVAEAELLPTHLVRLGLALNLSVFYYEMLNSSEKACRVTEEAFDDIVSTSELDSLKEDSMLIMQLMRDNLTLWTSHK